MTQTQASTRLNSRYGSWAIVTGASSGIGEALAKHLAASGINLLLVASRYEPLESLALHLKFDYAIEAIALSADLSTQAGVHSLLSTVLSIESAQNAEDNRRLGFGLVILNAGVGTSGEFAQSSLDKEAMMLSLNCVSTLHLTHFFSKHFKEKRRGGIVFLSSLVGFQGVPYAAHYAATKAYVLSLGEALAVELAPFGVDILTAAPGPVRTGFGARAKMNMSVALSADEVAGDILKALGRKHTVHPGWLSKLLKLGLSTVPRFGKIKIMTKVMKAMIEHRPSQERPQGEIYSSLN